MDKLITAAIPGAERLAKLDAAGAGHFLCAHCFDVYPQSTLRLGRGRHLGEHPEHLYCLCGASVTWYGSLTYDQLQASKRKVA